MAAWDEFYVTGKYHLIVSERMFQSYGQYSEKRFLIGVINELAKCVSNIIRAALIFEGANGKKESKKNLDIFVKKAPKYLAAKDIENLRKVLEVERAHKVTPVEFARKGEMILLVDGKYRYLKVSRLKEFVDSAKLAVERFGEAFRK